MGTLGIIFSETKIILPWRWIWKCLQYWDKVCSCWSIKQESHWKSCWCQHCRNSFHISAMMSLLQNCPFQHERAGCDSMQSAWMTLRLLVTTAPAYWETGPGVWVTENIFINFSIRNICGFAKLHSFFLWNTFEIEIGHSSSAVTTPV